MSIDVMVAVYRAKLSKYKTETAMVRKAVALKLADCANDDGGSIHPSIKRIADEVEISERSVQRVIAGFLEQKLLLLDNKGWNGITNRYRFNLNILSGFPRTRPSPCEGGDTLSPGDTETPGGDTETPGGDTETPKPSLPSPTRQRSSARAKPKLKKEEAMEVDPVTGISAGALARGYELAEGWDHANLMDRFLDLPEANNPDAAWIGFCRRIGEHGDAKERRYKSSVPPETLQRDAQERAARAAKGELETITTRHPLWVHWLDRLRARGERQLADQIEAAGAMTAPMTGPVHGCPLPKPLAKRAVLEAAE